jgi:hypothetical protein
VSNSNDRNEPHLRPLTFAEALEKALGRVAREGGGLVGRGLLATSVFVAPIAGCSTEGMPMDGLGVEDDPSFFGGKGDWARENGRRDRSIVSYRGDNWAQARQCYNRGGCSTLDAFIKLRVRSQSSVEQQRVGIVYSQADGSQESTALGYYNLTYDDGSGDQEYIVPITLHTFNRAPVRFTAWYQAQAYGATVYDDNEGEQHLYLPDPFYVLNAVSSDQPVVVDDDGVHGRLAIRVSDIDYDKDIQIVYTTDGWATYDTMGLATAEEAAAGNVKNRWYWAQDFFTWDEFHLDIDLPEATERFEYAIVFRHGVVGDARRYEFWLNNGGRNFVVDRAPVVDPGTFVEED